MFSAVGIAGLWALQVSSARNELYAAYRRDSKEGAEDQRVVLGLGPISAPGSPAKPRTQNLSQTIKDGAIICFRDKRGQTAVVQPCGTGRTQWQLAVTCASGGCCRLSQGEATLQFVAADATFLVCRTDGNKFAFRSFGAEGRYLAATRDLNEAPVMEHQKVTQAAQWKVTNSGIVNLQYGHKRLAYTAHGLKAVPMEAIAAMERMYDVQLQSLRDQAAQAEAVAKCIDKQLQGATAQLVAAHQQHADMVEILTRRCQKAEHHTQKLEQAAAVRHEGILQLEGYLQQLKHQHEKHEHELLAAYDKVAQLQQQLGDVEQEAQQQQTALQDAMARDAAAHEAHVSRLQRQHRDQVEQLTTRHKADAKHWAELRAKLEYNLHHKHSEVDELSGKVHRLDAALREVQRLMCGSSRRYRVDRASLDTVSICQLQHAVTQLTAAGEGGVGPGAVPSCCSSMRESQAIHKLLSSQPLSDGSSAGDFNEHHHHHQQQQELEGDDINDINDICFVGDLEWTADQSPRKGDLQVVSVPAGGVGCSVSPPDAAAHLHDSPLMKLAAISSNSTLMSRGGTGGSPGSGRQQASVQASTTSMPCNRCMHSAVSSGGSGWGVAAAVAGGHDARISSWSASGTLGHQASHPTCSSAIMGLTPGQHVYRAAAVDGEQSAHWGTDLALSGSSRQAGSFTSSDHAHRYSCSELSDADSDNQAAAEIDGQLEDEDLEAIHSVGHSSEDLPGSRRRIIRSSGSSSMGQQPPVAMATDASHQQQQQPPTELEGSGLGGVYTCGSRQHQYQLGLLRSSSGILGRSSLTPVKEEQPEQVCSCSGNAGG